MAELRATLTKEQRRSLKISSEGMYTKKIKPDGTVQITGGKKLKESGAYTAEFGEKVAQLFKKGVVSWHLEL